MTAIAPIGASPLFPVAKLAVIGTGLMGGSIAWAARNAGLEVVTYDVDPGTCDEVRRAGFPVADTPGAACAGADVVVLAAHVDELLGIAPMIRPYLEPDTIVTDIASVKTPVRALVDVLGTERVSVIPSHPMAGSEHRGFAHASAALLAGCTWLVCTDEETVQTARLANLCTTLGAKLTLACPLGRHDALVAVVSHFPQVVATLLAGAVLDAEGDYAAGALAIAGPGFRDTTRLADSPAGMWRPILEANHTLVATLLRRFADTATAAADELDARDLDAIDGRFVYANEAREHWRHAQGIPTAATEHAGTSEVAEPTTWTDPRTGHRAWLDRSLGWETVRTSAESAVEHREVAAGFLAELLGADDAARESLAPTMAARAEVRADARQNYRWVNEVLRAAGITVEEYETWTADGLPVGGLLMGGDRFLIVA